MERAGFLRDADPERGIGIVDLDGDSVRLDAEQVLIPHPVLLDDLADLREFAAELGVEQGLDQLFRDVWPRPETVDATALEWGPSPTPSSRSCGTRPHERRRTATACAGDTRCAR